MEYTAKSTLYYKHKNSSKVLRIVALRFRVFWAKK